MLWIRIRIDFGGLDPDPDLGELKIGVSEPDSIRSVDPDSEPRYRSRAHKNKKSLKISCFEVLEILF